MRKVIRNFFNEYAIKIGASTVVKFASRIWLLLILVIRVPLLFNFISRFISFNFEFTSENISQIYNLMFTISTFLIGLVFSSMSVVLSACDQKKFPVSDLKILVYFMKHGMLIFAIVGVLSIINNFFNYWGHHFFVSIQLYLFGYGLFVFWEIILSTIKIVDTTLLKKKQVPIENNLKEIAEKNSNKQQD